MELRVIATELRHFLTNFCEERPNGSNFFEFILDNGSTDYPVTIQGEVNVDEGIPYDMTINSGEIQFEDFETKISYNYLEKIKEIII